jgi:DNA (cytosine-5)-methyltransferase 1
MSAPFAPHVAPWLRGYDDLYARLAGQIGEIPTYDEFCGAGGLSQGAANVPGVVLKHAANHLEICIRTHAANFPDADHYQGDVRSIDVAKFPYFPLFLAAPSCPPFTDASGKRRDFDRDTQGVLFETESDAQTTQRMRGRLLMHEVPRYLEAMALRGQLVLAGVVENVPQARKWSAWQAWISRIKNPAPGVEYRVKVIALNSMHARPVRTRYAPQSRNRLYVAYSLASLPAPDWDKWLRPRAWCPDCEEWVYAMQVFKNPRLDMGVYGRSGQYWYRCPHRSCKNRIVEPGVMPSGAIIDWTDLGTPIGDRSKPLADSTRRRIAAGIIKYATPIMAEVAGHTFERHPGVRTRPVTAPMPTQQCTATRALCTPPLIVPTGGSWQDVATSTMEPIATQQTRDCNGLAVPPLITPMFDNTTERTPGSRSRPVTGPVSTHTTRSQNALVVPPFITPLRDGNIPASVAEALGTVSTHGGHHALTVPPGAFVTVLRNTTGAVGPADPLTTISTGNHHYLTCPPFTTVQRDGDQRDRNTALGEPLPTFVANGGHQSLVVPDAALVMRNNLDSGAGEMSTPVSQPVRTVTTKGHQSLVAWWWQNLLVPYYGTGQAHGVSEPAGTMTAKDRFGLASLDELPIDLDAVLFRMLKPEEIAAAMAFADDYIVLGTREQQIMQLGNAVTPPVGEIIVSALVEVITGVQLPRDLDLAA